jgi:hypothetical protein
MRNYFQFMRLPPGAVAVYSYWKQEIGKYPALVNNLHTGIASLPSQSEK